MTIETRNVDSPRRLGLSERAARVQTPAIPVVADWIRETRATRGAFYVLTTVRARADAATLVERLIREHKIAAIPGGAFGIDDRCAIRLSYGPLDEKSAGEAARRFTRGLRSLLGKEGKA